MWPNNTVNNSFSSNTEMHYSVEHTSKIKKKLLQVFEAICYYAYTSSLMYILFLSFATAACENIPGCGAF